MGNKKIDEGKLREWDKYVIEKKLGLKNKN